VSALHGGIVPAHVVEPGVQEQPSWLPHVVESMMVVHALAVPVQVPAVALASLGTHVHPTCLVQYVCP
jgi:hypothetical protein